MNGASGVSMELSARRGTAQLLTDIEGDSASYGHLDGEGSLFLSGPELLRRDLGRNCMSGWLAFGGEVDMGLDRGNGLALHPPNMVLFLSLWKKKEKRRVGWITSENAL